MQTALAARADTLVTENWRDFRSGETRHGVTFMQAEQFLEVMYQRSPEARTRVEQFLSVG